VDYFRPFFAYYFAMGINRQAIARSEMMEPKHSPHFVDTSEGSW
jgi:hypothetical protein